MCIENCPVHTRTDVRDEVQDHLKFRVVTYLGDKCVVTTDNPGFSDPATMLGLIFGGIDKEPKIFKTMVVRVGDGPLLTEENRVGFDKLVIFKEDHTELTNDQLDHVAGGADANSMLTKMAHDHHDMVVDFVKSGMYDD